MIVTYGTPFNGGLERRLPVSLRRKLRRGNLVYTERYKAQRAVWRSAKRVANPPRFYIDPPA